MDMKDHLKITIVICTYNRESILRSALCSFLEQKGLEEIDYEIIVVDNGSTDGTRKLLEKLSPKFNAKLRYIFEERKGLPYARNAGIEHSRGDIIAFTDDDCRFEQNYLCELNNYFCSSQDDIDFIGGKIKPIWPNKNVPVWIRDDLLGPVALFDKGDKPFVLTAQDPSYTRKIFFGANFAFKKEVFERYGKFNTLQTYAQDTEICLRLLKSGVKGMYCPNLIVYHHIDPDRMTSAYYYQWFYRRGVFQSGIDDYAFKFYHFLGVPLWIILQAVISFSQSFLTQNPYDRMKNRCHGFLLFGEMRYRIRTFLKKLNKKNTHCAYSN